MPLLDLDQSKRDFSEFPRGFGLWVFVVGTICAIILILLLALAGFSF